MQNRTRASRQHDSVSCVYLFRHRIAPVSPDCHGHPDEHPVSACTAGFSPLFMARYFGCAMICSSYASNYFGMMGIEPMTLAVVQLCLYQLRYIPNACLSRLSQCIYSSFAALPYTATTSRSHLSRKWAGTGSLFVAFPRNLLHKVDPSRFLSPLRMVHLASRWIAQPKSPSERRGSNPRLVSKNHYSRHRSSN